MKNIIFIALITVCSTAFARSATNGASSSNVDSTGIVTPNIATGMRQYEYFNNDTDGNMLLCEDENYSRGNCKGGWKHIESFVPSGKKYVGFRIVSRSYGYRQLELYWK